jgi:hypothetical protein
MVLAPWVASLHPHLVLEQAGSLGGCFVIEGCLMEMHVGMQMHRILPHHCIEAYLRVRKKNLVGIQFMLEESFSSCLNFCVQRICLTIVQSRFTTIGHAVFAYIF